MTGSYPPMKCGVGEYTSYLTAELSKCENIHVGVLTSIGAVSTATTNIDVFPIVKGGKKSVVGIVKLLREWKPDIVHIQTPTMGYAYWGSLVFFLPILVKLMRIPIIMTWHEIIHIQKVRWLYAFLLKALVVVRPNYMDSMSPFIRQYISSKVFKIIPNASTIPIANMDKNTVANVRKKWGLKKKKLVVYFGFANPNKRIEDIFEIANPKDDHVALLCDLDVLDAYQKKILDIAKGGKWKGHVTITGFLPPSDVSEVLAAADAVVLPFEFGGGVWNTSIHAVVDQGTFLLTTSLEGELGYSGSENIYRSQPGNLEDMKKALREYGGMRISSKKTSGWHKIATDHIGVYKAVLGESIE